MSQANDLAQLKMEQKTTLKASDIHVHDFRIDARERGGADEDIFDQINRAARQTSQSQTASTLRVSAIETGFDGLRAQLGDDEPKDVLLREAKGLVHQKEYDQALAKIDEIFAIDEHHQESRYLQAYCFQCLGRTDDALSTLLILRGAVLTNRLQACVHSLKEEIRQQTIPDAAKIYREAVKSKKASSAVGRLRQYAEADPGSGKLRFFLVAALLIDKQLVEAREVAILGLEDCEDGRDELQQLLRSIDTRVIPKWLGPARESYRKGNYREAARRLDEVAEQASSNALWITFHKFMEEYKSKRGGLISRLLPGSVKTVEAPGDLDARNELYEFLVKPEMAAARRAIDSDRFDSAEKALTAAVGYTPYYSLPNHLLATCVYQRVGKTVKQRLGKDLDASGAKQLASCKQQLDAAAGFAKIGCRDPAIEDARQVAAQINTMQKEIQAVLKKYEDQVHDAKIVNATIEELLTVFKSVAQVMSLRDPAQIRTQVHSLHSTLARMRKSLASHQKSCRGPEARKLVVSIRSNFVDPLYNELNKVIHG